MHLATNVRFHRQPFRSLPGVGSDCSLEGSWCFRGMGRGPGYLLMTFCCKLSCCRPSYRDFRYFHRYLQRSQYGQYLSDNQVVRVSWGENECRFCVCQNLHRRCEGICYLPNYLATHWHRLGRSTGLYQPFFFRLAFT